MGAGTEEARESHGKAQRKILEFVFLLEKGIFCPLRMRGSLGVYCSPKIQKMANGTQFTLKMHLYCF